MTVASDLSFGALADPVRREILGILAERGECSAGAIADAIQRVGRTSVSMHLRVLLDAGFLSARREGRFHYFSVRPDGAAQEVIRVLQRIFDTSLSDLEERSTSVNTEESHERESGVG